MKPTTESACTVEDVLAALTHFVLDFRQEKGVSDATIFAAVEKLQQRARGKKADAELQTEWCRLSLGAKHEIAPWALHAAPVTKLESMVFIVKFAEDLKAIFNPANSLDGD